MEKIPVIYWSGTGNTKLMAEAVAEGIGTAQSSKALAISLLNRRLNIQHWHWDAVLWVLKFWKNMSLNRSLLH